MLLKTQIAGKYLLPVTFAGKNPRGMCLCCQIGLRRKKEFKGESSALWLCLGKQQNFHIGSRSMF